MNRLLPISRGIPKIHKNSSQVFFTTSARRLRIAESEETAFDLEDVEPADDRNMSSFGWEVMRQQKQFNDYMRLLEKDVPILMSHRKEFTPSKAPLIVRTIQYAGEPNHPASRKRTVCVPVSSLPLTNDRARHCLKMIAGTRWSLEPPKDSGVGLNEANESDKTAGYIKLSSEDFPASSMNLKWAFDVLERMVKEANERAAEGPEEAFEDLPLDTRYADARRSKKGRRRVTINEFPKEWLPQINSTS